MLDIRLSFIKNKIGGALGSLIAPQPSFFDWIVILGVIPIGFLDLQIQGIYLVWFSVFLFILSLSKVRQYSFNNAWLTVFLLWAFFSVFRHSWIPPGNFIFRYINFALMLEGFIYMLFGVLLIKIITEYSTNIRLLFITIPIAAYPMIKQMIYFRQMSLPCSIAVGILIFLFLRKKYILLAIAIIAAIILANYYHTFLSFKGKCRPYVFAVLFQDILKHPFVGSGFNDTLMPDNMMWVNEINGRPYGWVWRHNNFLSIAAYLGAPILIPIFMFLKDMFMRFRKTIYIIPFVAFCVLNTVQYTIFNPYKALIILVSMALFVTETKEETAYEDKGFSFSFGDFTFSRKGIRAG